MHGRATESIDEQGEEGADEVISADQPKEASTTAAPANEFSDPIHELMATETMTLIRCVRCDNETPTKGSPLIVSLVCPSSQSTIISININSDVMGYLCRQRTDAFLLAAGTQFQLEAATERFLLQVRQVYDDDSD